MSPLFIFRYTSHLECHFKRIHENHQWVKSGCKTRGECSDWDAELQAAAQPSIVCREPEWIQVQLCGAVHLPGRGQAQGAREAGGKECCQVATHDSERAAAKDGIDHQAAWVS